MSVDMADLFAARSVSRFFLNFPDPWFKSRQHKRRVVSPLLIADIGAALCPGGEMFVQTDIFDIALEAMATLEEPTGEHRFENALSPWSFFPQNPYGARSRRERQCEMEATPIWRLLYRRV
jgi:tRNA (guanine-N7-)-methyltransferase